MTLTQLRTFMAVADTGSVRAASERLVVTQSAVSAALAALQQSLGVRLIARDGRGLRLTDAGQVYAAYTRRVLGLLDEAHAAAHGGADPTRGQVRLAAVTTAGEQLVPAMLAGFRSRYPNAGLSLEVGNRDRVMSLLHRHEVDLVVGGRPQGPGVATLAVRPNELVVVGPASLADEGGGSRRRRSWLARQTWLLRETGSGTRATTEAFFERHQISPRTLALGSNGAVRESVVAGLGITLISRDAVGRELADGTIVELPAQGTPLRRDWHLVGHDGEHLPATAGLLIDHVLDSGEFHPAHPGPRRGPVVGREEAHGAPGERDSPGSRLGLG